MARSNRRAGLTGMLVAGVLSFTLVALAAAPTSAADPEAAATTSVLATPTQALSGAYPYGMALALDAAGHRHVVATNRVGDVWYSTDRSGTWARQRVMRGDAPYGAWMAPTIAIDTDQSVHIAASMCTISDTPGSCSGISYVTDKGRATGDFGLPQRVAGDGMTDPSLKVAGGVLYLAYARCICVPEQGSAPVFFKTDRGGIWHKEQVAAYGLGPALRLSSDGRARIAYTGPSGVRYSKARTRLGDFTTPVLVPGSASVVSAPSLALDGHDRAHIAWVGRGQGGVVRYTRRTVSGWGAVASLGAGRETELSLDARGRPHLVVVRTGTTHRVLHRWRTASGWKSTTVRQANEIGSVAIRAFGSRAVLAWAQGGWSQSAPRDGVWVVRD